jgi:myo-inositol 2-dehydrogenase/D-chiro-inositol 1-dehydrogenase
MGGLHARTIAREIRGAEVVALADVDLERAREVGDSLGVGTVFDDAFELIAAPSVEAVLVASSAGTHEELVLAALDVGKPVLCEKPLATTAEGSRRVVEAEAALGRRLVQVGFMRRFDAAYLELEGLLRDGAVGAPLLVHCAHRNPSVPDGVTSAVALTESVVHEADVTRWLLGEEIAAVTVLAPRPTRHAPPGVRDPQLVVFETEGGVLVDVESFLRARYGYDVRCEVVGEEGTVALAEPALVRLRRDGRASLPFAPGLRRWTQAYRDEVQAWVDTLAAGAVAGATAWDGYAAAAVMDAAVESLAAGRRTEVVLRREGRQPVKEVRS